MSEMNEAQAVAAAVEFAEPAAVAEVAMGERYDPTGIDGVIAGLFAKDGRSASVPPPAEKPAPPAEKPAPPAEETAEEAQLAALVREDKRIKAERRRLEAEKTSRATETEKLAAIEKATSGGDELAALRALFPNLNTDDLLVKLAHVVQDGDEERALTRAELREILAAETAKAETARAEAEAKAAEAKEQEITQAAERTVARIAKGVGELYASSPEKFRHVAAEVRAGGQLTDEDVKAVSFAWYQKHGEIPSSEQVLGAMNEHLGRRHEAITRALAPAPAAPTQAPRALPAATVTSSWRDSGGVVPPPQAALTPEERLDALKLTLSRTR